jgi:dynein heavy chain
MFSLLLTIAIMQQKGQVDSQEWRFLLAGPTAGAYTRPLFSST